MLPPGILQQKQEVYVPHLRQDLELNPAPPEEGAPMWTLYDPSANKFYKIGWMEFECLTRFSRAQKAGELAALVRRETTLDAQEEDVEILVRFLILHGLVQSDSQQYVDYLGQQKDKRYKSWWEHLMHSYLYFTIPLFHPQKFLNALYPLVSFMFTRGFFTGVLVLLGYGTYLTMQRLDEVGATFMSYMNLEGVLALLTATVIVKVVHEMGHALMATRFKVPVPTMGIALIVLYPVLYAETSSAWRMQDRRQRLLISMAGVMAEMTLASVALILWHMLPPGMTQSVCFMVAIVSLLASIGVNANPLMRFDGYYLMCDIAGFDNMQDRSFAFAKWKLRQWLFDWQVEPPEQLAEERQNFLILFGFSTLIYRFFLFTGIAFLVYYMFFKPLGLILFLVEIVFFILAPIFREVRVWLLNGRLILSTARGKVMVALFLLCCLMPLIPAQESVEVPAVLHAGSYKRVYPPLAAQVVEVGVTEGMKVREGQLMFRLQSLALEHNRNKAQIKLDSLVNIRDREQASPALTRQRLTLEAEIDSARKEVEGLDLQRQLLTVTAPFDGVVRDLNVSLREGMWLNSGQLLAVVVGPDSLTLSGYVGEQDLPRIKSGAEGWFYAEYSPYARFPVMLKKVEDTDTQDIFWPELTQFYGGALPAERDPYTHNIRPARHHPIYAAQFNLRDGEENAGLPSFTATGTIVLDAKPVSAISIMGQRFMSLIMRESGF